eukprot:3293294-Alexandrium_andersonii.AAC.1
MGRATHGVTKKLLGCLPLFVGLRCASLPRCPDDTVAYGASYEFFSGISASVPAELGSPGAAPSVAASVLTRTALAAVALCDAYNSDCEADERARATKGLAILT